MLRLVHRRLSAAQRPALAFQIEALTVFRVHVGARFGQLRAKRLPSNYPSLLISLIYPVQWKRLFHFCTLFIQSHTEKLPGSLSLRHKRFTRRSIRAGREVRLNEGNRFSAVRSGCGRHWNRETLPMGSVFVSLCCRDAWPNTLTALWQLHKDALCTLETRRLTGFNTVTCGRMPSGGGGFTHTWIWPHFLPQDRVSLGKASYSTSRSQIIPSTDWDERFIVSWQTPWIFTKQLFSTWRYFTYRPQRKQLVSKISLS